MGTVLLMGGADGPADNTVDSVRSIYTVVLTLGGGAGCIFYGLREWLRARGRRSQ